MPSLWRNVVTQHISPCMGTCLIDPYTESCIGCYRTLTEIQEWKTYSEQQKDSVNVRVRNVAREYSRRVREEIRQREASNLLASAKSSVGSERGIDYWCSEV